MNRLIITVYISIASLGASAMIQPDSILIKANEQYVAGNFEKAVELYQTLVDSSYVSADLYYNLGNSYFKLNRIPNAILNYERAMLLSPNDEDTEFNLEFARTLTVDRIEALPEFFLTKWYKAVKGLFSSNGWAWFSLFWIASLLALALTFWFALRPWVKRLSFSLAILSFILAVSTGFFSSQEKQRLILRSSAIVFQPVVTVKSSPGEAGKELFILHSGTKVRITKAVGQWVEIRIADGNKGWIPSEAIELI